MNDPSRVSAPRDGDDAVTRQALAARAPGDAQLLRAAVLLTRAILLRRPVSATYDGHPRLLCPHVLGLNRDGRLQLLAYQFGGQSSSGPVVAPADPTDGPAANWRCLAVEGLGELALLEPGTWYTCRPSGVVGGGGVRRQTCVAEVLVEVTLERAAGNTGVESVSVPAIPQEAAT